MRAEVEVSMWAARYVGSKLEAVGSGIREGWEGCVVVLL